MMKFSVTHDIAEARRSVALERKEINKAAARSLNRVATTARKVADQKMRERITLKSRVVKDAFQIVFPYGRDKLIRDIVVTGSPIPLRDWAARKTKSGVTFAVVKGGRKKYRRLGRPGFIVEKIGGHVFVRTTDDPPGPQKAKIQKVFGPSLTHRFRVRAVQEAIAQSVRQRWPIEFERELIFRRSKS